MLHLFKNLRNIWKDKALKVNIIRKAVQKHSPEYHAKITEGCFLKRLKSWDKNTCESFILCRLYMSSAEPHHSKDTNKNPTSYYSFLLSHNNFWNIPRGPLLPFIHFSFRLVVETAAAQQHILSSPLISPWYKWPQTKCDTFSLTPFVARIHRSFMGHRGLRVYPIFDWEYWLGILSNWKYLEPMMQQLHSFLLFCCCEEKMQHLKVKASSV